jgi:hypothetical protein
MSGIAEIMKAVQRLNPVDFLKLRSALDRVEEKLWDRELGRVSAKHRQANLTDARIDDLVQSRRYKGRRP